MKTLFLFFIVAVAPATTLIQNAGPHRDGTVETKTIYRESARGKRLTKTNDNSPEILYFGDWSETKDPSSVENNQHLSNIPYANCYFTFNRSIVRWYIKLLMSIGHCDRICFC